MEHCLKKDVNSVKKKTEKKINEKAFDIRDTNYLLDTDLVALMKMSFLRWLNEYSGNTFTKSAFDFLQTDIMDDKQEEKGKTLLFLLLE